MTELSNDIKHEGYVLETVNGIVTVRVIVKSACGDCHIKGACSLSEITEKKIQVKTDGISFLPNEKVIISMKTSLGLKAVFYGYLLPFILILLSLILFVNLLGNEGQAAGLALLVIGIYYLTLYFLKGKFKKAFNYRIDKIVV